MDDQQAEQRLHAKASRREFMVAGVTSLASVSGSPLDMGLPAQQQDVETDAQGFQGVAHLVGPASARPAPDSDFFEDEPRYAYLYEVTRPAREQGTKYVITNRDDVWRTLSEPLELPETMVGEVKVEDFTSFFNHTFARPGAPDDKNWSYTDADVTKFDSEVELASTTSLQTMQRGNYPPGTEAIPGVAWRVTGIPTAGTGTAGYFTATNGIGAGEDSTDSYVFLRKAGNEYRVHREDWNGYVPSERVWTNTRPVITRFPHLFYGGGDLKVRAVVHGEAVSRLRTLHTFTPENIDSDLPDGPPIDQPNLPVMFESDSLTGGAVRANAAHYEFGESESENRVNGEHYTGVSAGTSGWTALISWRKRSGWEMVNVKPLTITAAAATADAKLGLQLGATLSGGTWTRPTNTSSDETAVEVNTGASLDAVGERRWVGFAISGQGNRAGEIDATKLDFNLPADIPVTLVAQGVGDTASLSGNVSWEEFF